MKLASAFSSDKRAIIKATALEVLSEPLALLMTLVAQLLAVLAPTFHYHQFGEPTRMARDAGISATMICGTILAVFGAVKSFRREIESGTAAVCLSHGIGRKAFFLAKACGVALAYGVFVLTVTATSLVMVNGAAIGGWMAEGTGALARIWGPSVALGLAGAVLPLVLGAVLNRFCRFRFVLTANLLALAVSSLGVCYRPDLPLQLGHAGAMLEAALPAFAYLCAACAFAARFRLNVAGALAALVVLVQFPFLKLWAVLPASCLFLYLGVVFFDECDIA